MQVKKHASNLKIDDAWQSLWTETATGASRVPHTHLPTDLGYTGQRREGGFGLMDCNARYYSTYLGRFISPDSIIPDAGNSMDWDRYAYVRNNPVMYNDPSGHCVGPLAFVCLAIPALVIMAPQTTALINQALLASNWNPDPNNPIDMAFAVVDTATSLMDMGDLTRGVSKVIDVSHVTDSRFVQNVIDKIDPRFFQEKSRFGKGFYVSESGVTSVAEVISHSGNPSHSIRFSLNISKSKVLDLTNPEIASQWGFSKNIDDKEFHKKISQLAKLEGYNVIRFPSFQSDGINYALLDSEINPFNFEEWLIPMGVAPIPE